MLLFNMTILNVTGFKSYFTIHNCNYNMLYCGFPLFYPAWDSFGFWVWGLISLILQNLSHYLLFLAFELYFIFYLMFKSLRFCYTFLILSIVTFLLIYDLFPLLSSIIMVKTTKWILFLINYFWYIIFHRQHFHFVWEGSSIYLSCHFPSVNSCLTCLTFIIVIWKSHLGICESAFMDCFSLNHV